MLRVNDLWTKIYTLLHQIREGVAGSGVLTGEVVGAAGNDGVEVGEWLRVKVQALTQVPQLHKHE
jgi:hypothetical protein